MGPAGHGVHGAVYRAVRAGEAPSTPVALKLALLPWDPRFSREAELLSRVNHPSVPRLLDAGEWQHPAGTTHPYLVMEWVDGTPLYDWAQKHAPSEEQGVRVLAQLARALEALHAQGAVHRDVKGGNVLVRHADQRAMLTDFGSGIHPGAATLTPPGAFTGTPAYRSAESSLFSLRYMWEPAARYEDTPSDDLYALGVTAYRLVTGTYPELSDPFRDEQGTWQLGEMASPAPAAIVPGLDPQLNALIVRMLRVHPEDRGTAKELAEALEQLARQRAPASPHERTGTQTSPRRSPLWPRFAAATMLLMLSAWIGWEIRGRTQVRPSFSWTEAGASSQEDSDTVGLGDALSRMPPVDPPDASVPEVMSTDTLPPPRPGQATPDAKGRCPRQGQLALNGGCWIRLSLEREDCEGSGYVFTSQCYGPVLQPAPPPPHLRARQPPLSAARARGEPECLGTLPSSVKPRPRTRLIKERRRTSSRYCPRTSTHPGGRLSRWYSLARTYGWCRRPYRKTPHRGQAQERTRSRWGTTPAQHRGCNCTPASRCSRPCSSPKDTPRPHRK
ncbi:Serine/threonine protein kinase [Stigmatella erecta]|uniref:Serine/threonine protein kinase n=2 Tax=Stigmatella erecta TaxID=83460 RepID=A0A1I0KQV4_9BACT|nr:serine/threonine-protein kinase [Stigmatella erecta]SEU27759.1 Serine/threonine protein kinase [Stigmatella erecta]